jgi:trimeric autotransporter adhesin
MSRKKILFFALTLAVYLTAKSQNIYTYAGTGSLSTSGDGGPALAAGVFRPSSVLIGAAGDLFITCFDHSIRMVNSSGIINTTVCCGGGDGNPAVSAGLWLPYGVIFDPSGNMYIADANNNRIRKVNTSSIISTTVGVGGSGAFGGDGGPAGSAFLYHPADVSFDAIGNMYIADLDNNRIRKVNTSGTITTIAGTGGTSYTGDGGLATAAQLWEPSAVKVDAVGNIYIADRAHHCIRKINSSGIISTIAGTGVAGHSGDGGPATSAQLNYPQDLVLDAAGNIFIAEQYYIRKVNNSGIVSTIAGTGVAGYSGDGGLAILAQFDTPVGLCLDTSGNIYVADLFNNRVRVICMSSCPLGVEEESSSRSFELLPNPASDKLIIQGPEVSKCILTSVDGKQISLQPNNNQFDVSNVPQGIYFLQAHTSDGILKRKIVIQR